MSNTGWLGYNVPICAMATAIYPNKTYEPRYSTFSMVWNIMTPFRKGVIDKLNSYLEGKRESHDSLKGVILAANLDPLKGVIKGVILAAAWTPF